MEIAVGNLYSNILENTYKIFLPPLTTANLFKSLQDSERKTAQYERLPEVLQRILSFWKDAPSSKSWALEKLTDVFCVDIANNHDILAEKDLSNLVKAFLDENGKLLLYPDFVMNGVAKLLTAVLLSGNILSDDLKHSSFNLIRSAFDYGLIHKGHRLHSVFQCYQEFLASPLAYDFMHATEYDLPFALAVALISGHNYTRESAKNHFVKLLKFAFEETAITKDNQLASDFLNEMKMKTEVKEIILRNLCAYNQNFLQCCSHEGIPDLPSTGYDGSIMAHYCELLCSCASTSDEWCKDFDAQAKLQDCSLFDLLLNLLKYLLAKECIEDNQLTVRTFQTLMKLAKLQEDAKDRQEHFDKLAKFVIQDVCQHNVRGNLYELMQIPHELLVQWNYQDNVSRMLLELALFPLLSVLDVQLSGAEDLNQEFIRKFTHQLKAASHGSFRLLVDQAVKCAFELDRKKVAPPLLPVIDYVTMGAQVFQSIPLPFLSYNRIRDTESLTFVLSCFKHLTPILYNDSSKVKKARIECIEQYLEALSNTTFTSFEHLNTVFSCFLAVFNVRQRATDCLKPPDKIHVSLMISSLQAHMVNLNASVREEAVKCMGKLYLLDDKSVTEELAEAEALVSLWRCVKDKAESVVSQVLDFILRGAKKGSLMDLLSYMDVTQEVLIAEVQNILLSSPWDSIKSTAFHILASVCRSSEIIRYAEVSLGQENPNLTLVVLKFMDRLFRELTDDKTNIDPLCRILLEGWGDLLLSQVNAQDINAFRCATNILMNLHGFCMNSEVNEILKKIVTNALTECDENAMNKDARNLEEKIVKRKKLLRYWENLGKSLRELFVAEGFSDGGDKCEVDEPPHKILKSEEGVSFFNVNEILLCTVAQCNRENVLREYHEHRSAENQKVSIEDECFIDSTKELPPMRLCTNPFPSQEILHMLLDSRDIDVNSAILHCLTFISFKEALARLNIYELHKEAHRSTDQYSRSEEMILEDLNNLLENAFAQTSRQVEKVIIGFFISDYLDLIVKVAESDDETIDHVLHTLDSFSTRLSNFISYRRQIMEYIISKRKTVFLEKWAPQGYGFTLDAFLERLKYLQAKGTSGLNLKEYHSTDEDIKHLLDSYMKENSLHQMPLPPVSESDNDTTCSEEHLKLKGEKPVPESLHSSESNNPISSALNSTSKEFITGQTNYVDMLQKACENIIQENKKKADAIFEWLKRVCEFLRQYLKDSKVGKEKVKRILILVTQMDHWYNNELEDEFDEDNDPTLIDCF